MSWALITLVADEITALLTGKTYPQKDAVPITMPIHPGSLPIKDRTNADEEVVPFVLIQPAGFQFGRPQNSVALTIVAAQYTAGDIATGLQAQDALLADLEQLKNGTFTGYKLMLPITGQIGDENQINPHPYYIFTMDLQFRKQI